MEPKKISTEFAVTVIIILTAFFGFLIWLSASIEDSASSLLRDADKKYGDETNGLNQGSIGNRGGEGKNITACTQEAKLCPDGKTYVSRSGEKCEFAPCLGELEKTSDQTSVDTSDWKTYRNDRSEQGSQFEVKYPQDWVLENQEQDSDMGGVVRLFTLSNGYYAESLKKYMDSEPTQEYPFGVCDPKAVFMKFQYGGNIYEGNDLTAKNFTANMTKRRMDDEESGNRSEVGSGEIALKIIGNNTVGYVELSGETEGFCDDGNVYYFFDKQGMNSIRISVRTGGDRGYTEELVRKIVASMNLL